MRREKIKRFILEGVFLEKVYAKIKWMLRVLVIDTIKGKTRKRIFKRIDTYFANKARRRLAKKTQIDQNKILFMTSRGSYNCNPKAIADEIIRQKLPWTLVWVARKENLKLIEQYPKELKIVIRGSYEFYQEAASAKVWIDNSVNLSYLGTWKKEGQVLLETWHGSLGLKRFETSSDKVWIKRATQCGERTDYCISNSDFEDSLFRNSFWRETEILKYGHPRNDILLTADAEKRRQTAEKIRRRFKIEDGTKIALYAPTFREKKDLSPYRIDYDQLYDALVEKFGGTWCVLIRFHFTLRILARRSKIKYPDFVIDATDYEDIQDLLLVTDVGITDYSSWICDFVLTKRPAFIFATDLRNYYDERGFYYPLETTPFPIAQTNEELFLNILSFDEKDYQQKCEAFLADKGCIEDGHASERVVEKLKEIIGEST